MSTTYLCRCCGLEHPGPALSYGAAAPAHWDPALADDEDSALTEELCIVGGEHFFIRARLVLPVLDAEPGTEFDWGVWVSLSTENFQRAVRMWEEPGRVDEPPYFGWLSTALPGYEPGTLNLATHVHTEPVGARPLVELEPTDHPLAVEQRTGVTLARVQEIAEIVGHGGG
ncbi:DUF2199 domain-containing protein [Actinocatenispora rupis]|uniref:DUF2199 domain-containing protein n=1 Tax=Actinocatenispora rupis TaxID=519421 RepID=A0A8J3J0A5_9ACTN|nr:DUF2199 domain-containing protein [Actinocatenispora rupis]GID12165.1 hypothetical protein Aru02nite_30540 [Actinocatenispora rupis]